MGGAWHPSPFSTPLTHTSASRQTTKQIEELNWQKFQARDRLIRFNFEPRHTEPMILFLHQDGCAADIHVQAIALDDGHGFLGKIGVVSGSHFQASLHGRKHGDARGSGLYWNLRGR